MRNLNQVAKECLQKLDAIDIPYGNITSFTVNTRAKKRWGQCRRNLNGEYSININVKLLYEDNDISGLENTIIHEILHTCPGCMNHGKLWRMYAEKVYNAYGYDVKRCSSAYEKGISGAEKPEKSERKRYERRTFSSEYVAKYIDEKLYNWNILINGKDFICIDKSKRYCTMVFRYVGDGNYTVRNCRKISAKLEKEIQCAEIWR